MRAGPDRRLPGPPAAERARNRAEAERRPVDDDAFRTVPREDGDALRAPRTAVDAFLRPRQASDGSSLALRAVVHFGIGRAAGLAATDRGCVSDQGGGVSGMGSRRYSQQ